MQICITMPHLVKCIFHQFSKTACPVLVVIQHRTRISFDSNSNDLFQRRWSSKASNWIRCDMHRIYIVVAVFNKHDAAFSGLSVGWRIQFRRAQIKCIVAHVYTSHCFFHHKAKICERLIFLTIHSAAKIMWAFHWGPRLVDWIICEINPLRTICIDST